MAAILDALEIPVVNLYGDSYGTYFAQTFATRSYGSSKEPRTFRSPARTATSSERLMPALSMRRR